MFAVPFAFKYTVTNGLVFTTGLIVSWTVTIAVPVLTLLLLSVTVNVTVFAPLLLHVNVDGDTLIEAMPEKSFEPLSTWEAVIEAFPDAPSWTVIFLVITVGLIVSWIVTIAELVFTLPLLSVTDNVTVLAPAFVKLNELGETLMLAIPQASFEPLFTWDAVIDAVPELFNWIVMFWVITTGLTVSWIVTVA